MLIKTDTKKYCMGSIVSVNGVQMAEIVSVNEYEVEVIYADSTREKHPWHKIRPVSLDSSFLLKIGFTIHKKMDYPHHNECLMEIHINGKFMYCKGVILKDRSLWNFGGITVRYLHEIQSIIWIINPDHKFKIH